MREISIEVNLLQQTLVSEVQSIQRTTASSKSSVLLAAFSCTQNSTRGLRLHVVAADSRCDQELSHSQPHRRMVESVAAAPVLNSSCRAGVPRRLLEAIATERGVAQQECSISCQAALYEPKGASESCKQHRIRLGMHATMLA